MSQFLPMLCACASLIKATAAVLEVAAIVVAAWTAFSIFAAFMVWPLICRRVR